MPAKFVAIGEVQLDRRRRVSLGRAGRPTDTRYRVEHNAEGVIRLIPLRGVPAREAVVWQDARMLESLAKGMHDAATGKVRSRGRREASSEG